MKVSGLRLFIFANILKSHVLLVLNLFNYFRYANPTCIGINKKPSIISLSTEEKKWLWFIMHHSTLPSDTALTYIVIDKMKIIIEALPIILITLLTAYCPIMAEMVATTIR